jgi:hypothetical protein
MKVAAENLIVAPVVSGSFGEDLRRGQKSRNTTLCRGLRDVSREGRWGSDGAWLRWPAEFSEARNRLIQVTDLASAGGAPTQIITYLYDVENRWIGENIENGSGVIEHETRFVYV